MAFVQLNDAAIMHATTFCMFICLLLLVEGYTIFNIWLFLLLQAMVWIPPSWEKIIWYTMMISSCAVIVGQYTVYIFDGKNTNFCMVGLAPCTEIYTKVTYDQTSLEIVKLYATYYGIMLTSVICIFVVNSKRYTQLWEPYTGKANINLDTEF